WRTRQPAGRRVAEVQLLAKEALEVFKDYVAKPAGRSPVGVPGAASCGRPGKWRSGEFAASTRRKSLQDILLRPESEFATGAGKWRTRPGPPAPLVPQHPRQRRPRACQPATGPPGPAP